MLSACIPHQRFLLREPRGEGDPDQAEHAEQVERQPLEGPLQNRIRSRMETWRELRVRRVLFVNILCFFLDTWDGSVGKIEGCETVFLTFSFGLPASRREREKREREESLFVTT